ncbi:MAG: hypothetical protein ABI851_00460 [Saprospiraceae bacterium]
MRTVLFIMSIFMVLSCHKSEDLSDQDIIPYGDGTRTKVEGRILEYGTNKILEGAIVILEETVTTGFFSGNVIVTPIDTFITDTSGKY